MNKQKQAFTLVELIVVITILAILGTIAFISLQGYSEDSRDSVRTSDMKNIEKGLELQLTKAGKVSMPENKLDINVSGTLIAYQGYAGEKVLNAIGVHGKVKDPSTEQYYTYVTNKNLTSYQILGFLEADNIDKDPNILGKKLGILIASGTSDPAQQYLSTIDLATTNDEFEMYFDENLSISGTGSDLGLIVNGYNDGIKVSCNDYIKANKNLLGKDGVYLIYDQNDNIKKVYCNMTIDGGGWTLQYANSASNPTNETYLDMRDNVFNNNADYELIDYTNSNLGGLLDYRYFLDKGVKETLEIYPDTSWLKTSYSNPDTLTYILGEDVIRNDYAISSCVTLPNNWTYSATLSTGSTKSGLTEMVKNSTAITSIVDGDFGCNGFLEAEVESAVYYFVSSLNPDSWNSVLPNPLGYRSFIR